MPPLFVRGTPVLIMLPPPPAVIVPHAHGEAYRRGGFQLHNLVLDSANPHCQVRHQHWTALNLDSQRLSRVPTPAHLGLSQKKILPPPLAQAQDFWGPLFFVLLNAGFGFCDALVEGQGGSFMSVIVHSVHNSIVPHGATPCCLF